MLEAETTKAMQWATEQDVEVDEDALQLANKDAWISHSQALYKALALKANKGEAATRIRKAGAGRGLEAWRLLIQYYEPKSRGRQQDVFRKLNKPNMEKSRSLLQNIEIWEQEVRDYEKTF